MFQKSPKDENKKSLTARFNAAVAEARKNFHETKAVLKNFRLKDVKFEKGDLGRIWRDTCAALKTRKEWGLLLAMTVLPYPGLPFITYGTYRVIKFQFDRVAKNKPVLVAPANDNTGIETKPALTVQTPVIPTARTPTP